MATLARDIQPPRSALMDNVTRLDADTAWAAFMRRDRSWDGRVIGAVSTTGVYCKPSCPARRPKREHGVSPAEYARALRNKRAETALKENGRVTDAIYDAGYSGPSGFYSDAKERLGMTPSAWRDGGRGETIRWTTFDSPLGQMLIAATSKGICRLTFEDSEASLKRLFPNATIIEDQGGLKELVEGALTAIKSPLAAPELPLDVAGTAFQEAVWRELRRIPPGETRSYAEIAAAIGAPKAVRAVGTANGENHVSVLIPCHRVIRSDGSLGGYGGGIDRKIKLLEAEGHPVAEPQLPLAD